MNSQNRPNLFFLDVLVKSYQQVAIELERWILVFILLLGSLHDLIMQGVDLITVFALLLSNKRVLVW